VVAEPLCRLSESQWANRVIVVSADRGNRDADTALQLLTANRADIDERDIVWFVIDGDTLHSNHPSGTATQFAERLRSGLRLQAGETLLIGKDGGIKSRSTDLNTTVLFALIDTMPMRQREMRERNAVDTDH